MENYKICEKEVNDGFELKINASTQDGSIKLHQCIKDDSFMQNKSKNGVLQSTIITFVLGA